VRGGGTSQYAKGGDFYGKRRIDVGRKKRQTLEKAAGWGGQWRTCGGQRGKAVVASGGKSTEKIRERKNRRNPREKSGHLLKGKRSYRNRGQPHGRSSPVKGRRSEV